MPVKPGDQSNIWNEQPHSDAGHSDLCVMEVTPLGPTGHLGPAWSVRNAPR